MARPADLNGLRLAYEVNAPDGTLVKVRGEATS
jgi:hypothetical protein